jgi:hypothetical protein
MTYSAVTLPAHLPEKLTISLWDFTWYTRTGAGEPYENLDKAFQEAVDRGYNTIRICAMPFLLFRSGLEVSQASFGPLGGDYAQGTRWYDVKHRVSIDAREHLLELFRAAKRHNVFIIVSSWEYQQSSSFYGDKSWFDALMAVEPEERAIELAEAQADLCGLLRENGLEDRIAFVELHNEVQGGYLCDDLPGIETTVVELKDRLTRGLDAFHNREKQIPCTVNYATVPIDSMRGMPENMDIGIFHPYVYGVLDDITTEFGLRAKDEEFDEATVQELLRDDAPRYKDWQPPAQDMWRKQATIVGKPEIYVHDWVDPLKWDEFLYEGYGRHSIAMKQRLVEWMSVAADFAAARKIPLVFGEGWIGYTPLTGNFEEGPIGSAFCRYAVKESAKVGAWGTLVCSNAAPHHPMWADVALQRELNATFLLS